MLTGHGHGRVVGRSRRLPIARWGWAGHGRASRGWASNRAAVARPCMRVAGQAVHRPNQCRGSRRRTDVALAPPLDLPTRRAIACLSCDIVLLLLSQCHRPLLASPCALALRDRFCAWPLFFGRRPRPARTEPSHPGSYTTRFPLNLAVRALPPLKRSSVGLGQAIEPWPLSTEWP
jgi:hypothetical protein